jgi:hypothetical protein
MPGEPEKVYLSTGLPELSGDERTEIGKQLAQLANLTVPKPNDDKAKLVLLTRMLLAYPSAGMTEKAAEARGEAYLFVLDDIPAWVVDQAIRTWLRGETGHLENMPQNVVDYRWAPPPPVLRHACLKALKPFRDVERKLVTLRDAKRLDAILRDGESKKPTAAAAPVKREFQPA